MKTQLLVWSCFMVMVIKSQYTYSFSFRAFLIILRGPLTTFGQHSVTFSSSARTRSIPRLTDREDREALPGRIWSSLTQTAALMV